MNTETLTLDIPFNKEEFISTNLFRFKLAHKPSWRRTYGSIITSGLFLLFTIFLYMTDQPNSVFLVISLVLSIVTGFFITLMIEARKKYVKRLNEIATNWEEQKMDCTFRFDSQGIHYIDKEKTMDLKWELFKDCLTNDSYIIFMTSDSFDHAYFLSRRQIDLDSWTKILEIAALKIPVRTISVD